MGDGIGWDFKSVVAELSFTPVSSSWFFLSTPNGTMASYLGAYNGAIVFGASSASYVQRPALTRFDYDNQDYHTNSI